MSDFYFPNVFVSSLADSLEAKKLVLSICGYSACAKSKTARRLRKALKDAALLPLSSFALPRGERLKAGFTGCNPRAFDLKEFKRQISRLQAGEDIAIPKYDHKTGELSEEYLTITADYRILIIEDSIGITPEIQQYADLTLCFFPENLENWRKFSVMRDVDQRGYKTREAEQLNLQNQRDIEDLLTFSHSDVDVWIQTRHVIEEGNNLILYRALEAPSMQLRDVPH